MTAPELLPCPFCGAVQPPHDDTSWIRCSGCGAETGWRADGAGAIAAWNRRTPSSEVAALIEEARREWCKKMDRIADEIDEQVKVTRAYVGDCGMDHNQKELMKICTSHFLDKAATIRALKEETP